MAFLHTFIPLIKGDAALGLSQVKNGGKYEIWLENRGYKRSTPGYDECLFKQGIIAFPLTFLVTN